MTNIANSPESDVEKTTDDKFIDRKIQFVLRDYTSYFEAGTRTFDRIQNARQVEVTLVVALITFLTVGENGRSVPGTAAIPFTIIIATFWIMEAWLTANLILVQRTAKEAERKLSTDSYNIFKKEIINWKYGNSANDQPGNQDFVQRFFKSLIDPFVLFWHGIIAIAGVVFFYFS